MKQCVVISNNRIKFLNSGPVGKHVDNFIDLLVKQGFSIDYLPRRLGVIADLNRWLINNKIKIKKLSDTKIIDFMSDHSNRFKSVDRGVHKTSLNLFLNLLQQKNIIKQPKTLIKFSAIEKILFEFNEYLDKQKGLSSSTQSYYKRYIETFLLESFENKKINLKNLVVKDVLNFILKTSENKPAKQSQLCATALRSFFQYGRLTEKININLSIAIPAIANRQGENIPESLNQKEVNRLLKACDQNDPVGMRDYAILLLLSRLGLRASEIIKLTLDDINWENSTIVIQRKGNKQEQLPIDHDTGKAIVRYLKKGRPTCKNYRSLFLTSLPPLRGIGHSSTLSTIVCSALKRAGLNPKHKGAHLLRHTAATQILRNGATLHDVGYILGHQSLQTTAIYAKVDFDRLRILAKPWPCSVDGGSV